MNTTKFNQIFSFAHQVTNLVRAPGIFPNREIVVLMGSHFTYGRRNSKKQKFSKIIKFCCMSSWENMTKKYRDGTVIKMFRKSQVSIFSFSQAKICSVVASRMKKTIVVFWALWYRKKLLYRRIVFMNEKNYKNFLKKLIFLFYLAKLASNQRVFMSADYWYW